MNNIIFFASLLTFAIYKGQANNSAIEKTNFEKNVQRQSLKINFLDKKYQSNGYFISDDVNEDSYPSYSYYNERIGSFSVNYIAKNTVKQNFWNINNKSGFFSKYEKPEDGLNDSKNILKNLNLNDYYVIVEYLSPQYINIIDKINGEFDIKANAITQFYLYEEDKWTNIGMLNTKKIPEKEYQYYIKLIQSHGKDKEIPVQYQGHFSIPVDTEITTSGIANITYNFIVSEQNVTLNQNTYHEPVRCDGTYSSIREGDVLKLYYSGNDMNCISVNPKFKIKCKKDACHIKGIGSLSTSNDWIRINKK